MFISSAIGGFVAGATGLAWLGTVAAGVTQTLLGVGLSLIAQSISGGQQQKARAFSMQVQLRSGEDQPRSINFGRNVTGGTLVYANTWGTGNRHLTQVIALGDMPIREFRRLFVDGKAVTLLTDEPHATRGWPVQQYRRGGTDHLWLKFYDGTQTTADPLLTGNVSSTQRPYDNGRVGRGIPYVIVTCRAPERADGEKRPLFQGVPQFKFETYGVRLFDPTDSGHVWNDPSTWGGDGDFLPAVQAYNVLRGIRYNGQWLYGLQDMTAARLPDSNWQAAINKCRQSVNTSGSGTEPQYRSGGELTVDTPIADVLDSLMAACQGRIVEVGGSYKCYVGEPGAAVFAFDDSDILSTEDQHFTPFFPLSDSVNGIAAQWPNPAAGWNRSTAKPWLNPNQEALDGNRRLMASITMDFVPYGGQVQRLQKSALLEALRARRHTITLGPEAWVLEPGDIVSWTSARNGYVDKLFRVDGVGDKANVDVLLDLTEVDPSDYDWEPETDYTPIIDGPVDLVEPPPLIIVSFAVYPAVIYDELARPRRPSIRVDYDSAMVDVQTVRIQVRTAGETNPFYDAETPYGTPFSVILPGQFSPNTDYEVRAIYVRPSGMEAEWTAWAPVTTPDVKLIPGEDFDPYEGVTGFDQLADDLNEYQNWMGQNIRELIEQAEAQATLTGDQELANSLQFDEMRRSLTTTLGTLEAEFQEVVTTGIIPIQGQLAAVADVLTQVTAADAGDVNTARFRMTALSGPSGYSRIGAEARADVGDEGDWRLAGWYLDTPNNPINPTRFMVVADQFVVTNGTNMDSPFIFDGSALRVRNAVIANLTAGNIMANSLDATVIDVEDIFAQNVNITGTLRVGAGASGPGVYIQGNNNRILIVDNT